MPKKITKTVHTVFSEEEIVKTPGEKAANTKKINLISALSKKLSKSISSAAHKQWMTKKDNEIAEKDRKIADLEQQLAEQKTKKNNNQRCPSKNRK